MAKKPNKEQIALAEKLQMILLNDYERLFTEGEPSAADRAALGKLLRENGWSLDPSSIPEGLASMLTKGIDPTQFEDDDADVPKVN